MEKFKNFLMASIAIIGIVLMGYHWEDGFYAFQEPTFANISFTLAIIFWSLMFMIVLKMWVQANITDKWKKNNIKRLKVICVVIIAFCAGSIIANFPYLISTNLTFDDIVAILCIPFMGTALYALKEDKKAGWIGGDPSKAPKGGEPSKVHKGGDIEH